MTHTLGAGMGRVYVLGGDLGDVTASNVCRHV